MLLFLHKTDKTVVKYQNYAIIKSMAKDIQKPAKTQIVVQKIETFFKDVLQLKDSESMKQYLTFCRRMSKRTPFRRSPLDIFANTTSSTFNSTLVFIQNPKSYYFLTKDKWEKLFNRHVKPNSRPMVILFPFGPVEFVYDIEDTEGEDLPQDLIKWWEEGQGEIGEIEFNNLAEMCKSLNIEVGIETVKELYHHSAFQMGKAVEKADGTRTIRLHPRYNAPEHIQEAFGVLVHEAAHHLLGHLGELKITIADKKGNTSEKLIARAFNPQDDSVTEVEAELCAWLLFAEFGVEKHSAAYVAQYIMESTIPSIRITEVCKAVSKISKMCQGIPFWVK
jgi:hypothetical protein